MSAVRVVARLLTLSLGIISLVAVAETYYDQKFYTADFMDEVQEVELRMPATSEKRIVASFSKKLPEVMPVTNAQKMKVAIDGNWQITRVIDDNDNIIYDFANREEDRLEKVIGNFEYSARTNSVRINGEIDQTYKISLMTVQGTIALFKEFGEGYEVVEARKVKEDKDKKEAVVEEQPKLLSKFSVAEDLNIISALDPAKNRNVLRGESITGSAYLKDGLLTLDNVQLHIGTKHQTETLSISEVNVAKHGTFNDDEGTQGIITNIGNDEVKIRFSTGPLAGIMLNFVTDSKRSEIERKFGTPAPQDPQLPGEEVVAPQENEANSQVDEYAQENREEVQEEVMNEEREVYEDVYQDEYQDESRDSVRSDEEGYEMEYEDQGLIEDTDEARASAANDLDREPASTNVSEVGFSF